MNKKIVIPIVVVIVLILGFFIINNLNKTSDEVVSYKDLSAEEAMSLIESNKDLIIIDVSPKYDEGHLPNAVNYPVGDGSLDAAIPMLDKTKTYLVYCHTDEASKLGAQKLVDAGFENVYRLEGNYQAWLDAGYPVEGMIEDLSERDITAMEAKEMIEKNPDLIIIDVSPEYEAGHIPGALNYPVGDGSLDEAIPTLDKTKTYLIYSSNEEESKLAIQKLIDAGFENVYRLEGDFQAWLDAGYEVVTGSEMNGKDDMLPKSGEQIPVFYYGLGGLLMIIGVYLGKKSEKAA